MALITTIKKPAKPDPEEENRIASLILRRRRQMLVHSYLYYELDENVIPDTKWNTWAQELADLQNKYPDISKKVEHYGSFMDWDGSTGCDLPYRQDWIIRTAQSLLDYRNKKLEE